MTDRVLPYWLVFFAICFGLGYPTLNRYDPPQAPGLSDTQQYFRMVTTGIGAGEGRWHYRILVPALARPIYRLATGHLGSWSPAAFALLVVNSGFCAGSAVMLLWIAKALEFSPSTGMIAALCYLLNFNVANGQLAGMVDSAEGFLLAVLVILLMRRWWNALPLLGLLSGLAKETFVPIACLFACGWVWRECGWVWREKERPWLHIGAMAVSGVGMVSVVRSWMDGRLVTPLGIVGEERVVGSLVDLSRNAVHSVGSWTVWITLLWLVPFAIRGMPRLPRPFLLATALGLGGALALAVWTDAGPNTSRPLFEIGGPYLCLAFAAGQRVEA